MTVERDEGFRAGELLPCPFCGSDNIAYVVGDGCEYTTCDECMADGPAKPMQEDAHIAWNTRALLPANAGQPDSGVTVADLRTPSDWVNSISGVKATDQFIALARIDEETRDG